MLYITLPDNSWDADCARLAKDETAGSKASCETVKDVIYLVTNGGRCYLL
jgi:hypothetical protein